MQAIAGRGRPVGKKPEVLRTSHGGFAHVSDRLTGIHTLDQGDLLSPGFDRVRDAMQQLSPGDTRNSSPVRKSPARRGDGTVHLGLPAEGNVVQ